MSSAMNILWGRLVCLVGIICFSFSWPSASVAMVTGACSNCHTMHNSQNGSAVAASAQNALMSDSCVGCHSYTGGETIIALGDSQVPIVFNTVEPTYPPDGSTTSVLAGGNFYWVAQGDDSRGHNVYGISDADSTLSLAPGSSTVCSPCHDSLAVLDTGNPAYPNGGCQGCHLAAHHADDSAVVVDAAAGSYRFLGDLMSYILGAPSGRGVQGIEAADWEQAPSSTNHNTYAGTSTNYSTVFGSFLDSSSIGQFCSGCHGNFHHQMNTESDLSGGWIRHPSDVVLPSDASKEYQSYTVYNPLVPVAKPVLSADLKDSPDVVPGTDVVTCLSCHRAHGSPYPDMLRWDYQNCVSGNANSACGCFVCHTLKDD